MSLCQIEAINAGGAYPKTCPTCGLGKCAKGLAHPFAKGVATPSPMPDLRAAIEKFLRDNDPEGFGCACEPSGHVCGPCRWAAKVAPLRAALSASADPVLEPTKQREAFDLQELLQGCISALRSYQYGNAAPDLAEDYADRLQAHLRCTDPDPEPVGVVMTRIKDKVLTKRPELYEQFADLPNGTLLYALPTPQGEDKTT